MKIFKATYMRRLSETSLRGIFFAFYFAVAFIVLLYFSFDDSFCARPGARNYWIMNGQLALALAAYSFIVTFGVAAVLSISAPKLGRIRRIRAGISALVVGLGVAFIPFWIYRGYGHFRFEGTWADVSCYFTEGFGLMFPFTVAPLLAIATYVQEIAILKLQR
jgi:hypothetical protein